MKTIKVSEATNTQLDWLVARCEGLVPSDYGATYNSWRAPKYTTDWNQIGPIVDRERMTIRPAYLVGTAESGEEVQQHKGWAAHPPPKHYWQTPPWGAHGETLLIAAARCYVASKLGETVEVPGELL